MAEVKIHDTPQGPIKLKDVEFVTMEVEDDIVNGHFFIRQGDKEIYIKHWGGELYINGKQRPYGWHMVYEEVGYIHFRWDDGRDIFTVATPPEMTYESWKKLIDSKFKDTWENISKVP